jgi:hypothetical protein
LLVEVGKALVKALGKAIDCTRLNLSDQNLNSGIYLSERMGCGGMETLPKATFAAFA